MKNFKRCRTEFGMAGKLAAVVFGAALALGFFGCKNDVQPDNIPEGFVKVTGGTFNGTSTLTPTSSVFISERSITILDLYVCEHEVTQKEYETYCKYGDTKPSETYGVGDNYPAYWVNWYDAIVYCNLRSIDEGLTPAYALSDETDPSKWTDIVSEETDGVTKYCGPSSKNDTWNGMTFNTTANGYRLPTEAEWEYIARGGSAWKEYTYSGSNTIDDVAWYNSNADNKIHKIKTKAANSLGIYDISGNVWEWCWDWYGDISASTGASGVSSGSGRVGRGGSWYGNDKNCTVTDRGGSDPNGRGQSRDFRVVRSVQ